MQECGLQEGKTAQRGAYEVIQNNLFPFVDHEEAEKCGI